MPVHHHLKARVGTTTDQNRHLSIYRRSLHHANEKRTQFLHESIHENVRRAAAKDGHELPAYSKRQSPSDFGGTTQSGGAGQTNQHGTTEQSAAQLGNPSEQCTPYTLPVISQIQSQFPAVWEVADILSGDTEATHLLQAINASGLIPAGIAPRGTQRSSLIGANLDGNYSLSQDPDCWWTDKMCTTPKHPGLLPDVTTCNEPYTWGYTFDDGPNCTHNALYDMWAANNQKASLMYIGSNVLDWPLEAQRGIVDGHHICVHTWSHRYMTALTTSQAFAELWYTIKVIKYVMGVTPTCWRPPYGDVDDRIRGIAQGLGLRTIMWNVDTNDWNIAPYGSVPTASMRQTYSSIISMAAMAPAATGGIIVLEHELEQSAMNMSIEQYPAVKAAWKHVVPLNACLNITHPYPEDISYPDFNEYIGGNVLASGLPNNHMDIASTAQVTAQGTLSGMGSTFPTASDGAGNSIASVAQTSAPTGTASGARSNASASSSSSARPYSQFSGASPASSVSLLAPILVACCAMLGALLIFV
ncbi:related to Chitin deacetylase precursor [Sporisorium reilianum SRZ2]|uniref:chitin deacetylase n=1 Tax=Sporisorium reilianum (strain SRZ2) TaxID=999809 RepID=E6ZQZ7_SPORE|nr:related to Chitin deacetylase precursor [Sporisorium reilianum SRZ2]